MNIYKKLAQSSWKTETEIMKDMYERKLIPKEENLRLRLSHYYFWNYEASKEDIEKQIENNLLSSKELWN